jgi:hypothetical protein
MKICGVNTSTKCLQDIKTLLQYFDISRPSVSQAIKRGEKYARKIPKELHPKARRLLDQLNASPTLGFLRIPPGNRLHLAIGLKKCLETLKDFGA